MAQPLLLVPPKQVQAVLSELAALRYTAQKWQHGGRYGVQIRKYPPAGVGGKEWEAPGRDSRAVSPQATCGCV